MSVSQYYVQILKQILDLYSILIPARQSVHHIAKVIRLYLEKQQAAVFSNVFMCRYIQQKAEHFITTRPG